MTTRTQFLRQLLQRIGLVFLVAFLVVLFRVFFRSKGDSLDRVASLPLQADDSPEGEPRSEGGRS